MRKTCFLFVLIVVTFIIICLYIEIELPGSVSERKRFRDKLVVKTVNRRTTLFFMKTHKCASTTIQNIIMRFGFKHGLYFVLPLSGNYLGNPLVFNPEMIKFTLPNNRKFDIFTHHTRYNFNSIKSVMKENSAFVTVLRDPADLFESLFTYYENSFKHYNISFNTLINTRNVTKMKRLNKTRYGLNQMLFDLGLDENYSFSDKQVIAYIKKLDSEFDLVMISEYMEASLVLFADLMKWRLEDVVYLSLNSRDKSRSKALLPAQRQFLHELNRGDWSMYKYFLSRFRDRLKQYGSERLKADVNRLISLNNDLEKTCVASTNTLGYARTISYSLYNNKWLCKYSTMNELTFTNEIRNFQRQRLDVLNRLEHFINNRTIV